MRKWIVLALLLVSFLGANVLAQEMPLVYEVENTGADCPIPYLPSFNELPIVSSLPDPFEWSDGRGRMANYSDWRYRREEIKAEIEHYEIGEKPVRPENITASYSNDTLRVNVTVNGKTLKLISRILLPSGEGPFPAVIGMNSPSGSIPSNILLERNIALIQYSHDQVTKYGAQSNSDPYYQLYPHLNADNTGQYSAWAWGVSRLIDGLELVQDVLPIDLRHLAVTGCSYAGKMALFSGAFDERIALTISIESGGGGYTTWRFSETLAGVETLGATDHNWFKESMFQFAFSNVSRLPHDHHELMAMVAPRALLVTGNPSYVWLADESGYVGSVAAKKVWEALEIPDRFGYSIVADHSHCAIPDNQLPDVLAFIDKFLLGQDDVNTNVAVSPYNTNLEPWITWTVPTLGNGTSFFGKTTLIYPANLQTGVDTTSVTFKWNKLEDAETYFSQLSTDPTFRTTFVSESTTDTTLTVTDLAGGQRYYWRVQAKNAEGSLGPWSDYWNFISYIPLPSAPQLVSANLTDPGRADYMTFKWRKDKYAAQYRIQVSRLTTFSPLAVPAATTSDTVITLSGFYEGQKLYWRVQAENIAGSSPWSEPSIFTVILPPSDLVIQGFENNKVTLKWKDNSKVEDGYVIERKQGEASSFSVLDSLGKNVGQYVDTTIEAGQIYIYRVQAYKSSVGSEYSNEVSLNLTGVKKEAIPREYSLSQNYPNPFNPTTTINYQLPISSYLTLKVYNLLGQDIATIFEGVQSAGNYSVTFDASGLTGGIYFYQLKAGSFVENKKFILLK
ncbi:MAG TPA: T9SS type A sorting domain-containing protein [Candidatus Marinimicrobia bacterium]|nr:T9SS type A sorting domain-containing protein [Candidatus Neomarinimicrobiota bacterium]